MIFLLSGKAQVGKDTIAQMIAKKCEEETLKTITLQISFYIKEYAKRISDWDGSEETKPRKFLQTLGTDIIRNKIDDQLFIRRTNEDIKVYLNFFDVIIISDIRLVDEIEKIKKAHEIKVINIHILRDTNIKINKKHLTEQGLDDYQDYDYLINNNDSIETLNTRVSEILEKELNNE